MFLCHSGRIYVKTRKMNVFVKPNEQCRACSNIAMARKRTFRGTRKEPFQATYYDANYNTSNSPSPHKGAIQIQNSFLIHSGPPTLEDSGWGSAGCVEIIGDFSEFKEDIKTVSGIG